MNTIRKLGAPLFQSINKEVESSVAKLHEDLQVYSEAKNPEVYHSIVLGFHQIVGVVVLLEISALCRLVKETEKVIEKLKSSEPDKKSVQNIKSALKIIMESLARIEAGESENLQSIVEFINVLRAEEGKTHIEISALFSPFIDYYPAFDVSNKIDKSAFTDLLKQLRHQYQVALLQWLKNGNRDAANQIGALLQKLLENSSFGVVVRLCWVGLAYIDFLCENAPKNKMLHVTILRKVDDYLRVLSISGEAGMVREPGDEVIKMMLFYIATAEQKTVLINEVSEAYRLSDYRYGGIKQSDTVEVNSVDNNINYENLPIKELRAWLSAQEQKEQALVDILYPQLREKIAEYKGAKIQRVLSLLLTMPAKSLETFQDNIASIVLHLESLQKEPALYADREWQERLAKYELFLFQEDVCSQDETFDYTLSGYEKVALMKKVQAEVSKDLKYIEEKLERYSKKYNNLKLIEGASQHAKQVRGALELYGDAKVSLLTRKMEQQFYDIESRKGDLNWEQVEALAVAVSALQEYLQGVQEGRENLTVLLDVAINDLDIAVGKSVSRGDVELLLESASSLLFSWLERQSDFELFGKLKSEMRDLLLLSKKTNLQEVENVLEEQARLIDVIAQEPAYLNNNIRATLQENMATITEQFIQLYGTEDTDQEIELSNKLKWQRSQIKESVNENVIRYHDAMQIEELAQGVDENAHTIQSALEKSDEVNRATKIAMDNADEDEGEAILDQSMVKVYIEESEEVTQNINVAIRSCQKDLSNIDAIRDLRRGFHTLKGSGRMVGLNKIGEVAWFAESLLNFILDTEQALNLDILYYTSDVVELVEQHVAEGYKNQNQIQVSAWGNRAEELVADYKLDELGSSDVTTSSVSFEEQSTSKVNADFIAIEDAEMRAVFKKDVSTVVERVQSLINETLNMELLSQELSIAAHTICGNARTMGISSVSGAFSSLEEWLQKHEKDAELIESELQRIQNMFDQIKTVSESEQDAEPYFTVDNQLWFGQSSHFSIPAVNAGEKIQNRLSQQASALAGMYENDKSIQKISQDLSILDGLLEDREDSIVVDFSEIDAFESSINAVKDSASLKNKNNRVGESGDIETTLEDDYDENFADIFFDELSSIQSKLENLLSSLGDTETSMEATEEIARSLHTIKGSAMMVGANNLSALTHNLEDFFGVDSSTGIHLHQDKEKKVLAMYIDSLSDALASYQNGKNFVVPTVLRNAVEQNEETENKVESQVEEDISIDAVQIQEEQIDQEAAVTQEEPDIDVLQEERIDSDSVYETSATPEIQEKESSDGKEEVVEDIFSDAQAAEEESRFDKKDAEGEQPHIDERAQDENQGHSAKEPPANSPTLPVKTELKIATKTLDNLTNFVSDVSVSRAHMKEEVATIKQVVDKLYKNITLFNSQIRELEVEADANIIAQSKQAQVKLEQSEQEFDPLELDKYSKLQQLSRDLAENLDSLDKTQSLLQGIVSRTEKSLQKQDRINSEIQHELMRVRLVEFGDIGGYLRTLVRKTADKLGKKVGLTLIGENVKLDKTVLDTVLPALEHMVRNALDHGIEPTKERAKHGKPEEGVLTVECKVEGREVYITVRDDGRGINVEAVQKKAMKLGIIKAEEEFKVENIMSYISRKGLSTAKKVTGISGRGVGMDVVQHALRKINGSIIYNQQYDTGTEFIISLPVSMAVESAIFVHSGDAQFAVSARSVTQITEIETRELRTLLNEENPVFQYAEQEYRLLNLSDYLNLASDWLDKQDKCAILLSKTGSMYLALAVERVERAQEVVIKNLGEHLGRIPIYMGGIFRANGEVVLMLNMHGIALYEGYAGKRIENTEDASASPLIMVVDDSLTVRKASQRDLSDNDYRTVMAKNGIEAQALLKSGNIPAAILLDIEMPRMDGYEFLRWIKSEQTWQTIPVIMISSRGTEKHIAKAKELGCAHFMSKPYLIGNLLSILQEYT